MKIIIVDDEMIERKAMRKLLEQHASDVQIVGEAGNGRVAVELAESLCPDVMLMDIKMPGMSGLEAIRHIRAKQPGIRFIMMTAYATFTYAKEAMAEGVKYYLVKPAAKKETIDTIRQIYEEVQKDEAAEKASEQFVLSKLLQQESDEEVCKQIRIVEPKAKMGFMHVYKCRSEAEKNQLVHFLHRYSPYLFLADQVRSGRMAVLFLTDHCEKASALMLARTVAKASAPMPTIGVSVPYTLKNLGHAYPEALLAFQQLQSGKAAAYGFPNQSAALPDNKAGKAILQNHPLKTIFSRCTLNELKEELVYAKKEIAAMGVYVEDVDVLTAKSLADCLTLGEELASRLVRHRQGKEMISQAKLFIHEHFHEPISLEDVAAHVQLSPTYFTKLFKEKTDETFIGYLTEYRIQAAKRLLQSTNLGLKEIACQTGYNDPNYFSRAFKKAAGCSPKEYRKNFS